MTIPARFVHSREDAARVFAGFRVLYWVIALVLGLAALIRPAIAPVAIVFPIVLLLWELQIRRASTKEWVLTIDAVAIEVGDKTVARADASFARFRRRRIRYAAWTELQVVGPAGKPIFTEGIRDDHRDGIAAALRDHGWPVE